MFRNPCKPREGWQKIVEEQGLIFPETDYPDGSKHPYWNESAWYEFTLAEVMEMEQATETLWAMCLDAIPKMLRDFDDDALRLPSGTLDLVRESIRRRDQSVYGRFDLRFDGGTPKMLELNGDTPTGLIETGAVQWLWKEAMGDWAADNDQWNSVHERLIERWRGLRSNGSLPGDVVHFYYSSDDTSGEEEMTTYYMADTARQAGLAVQVHDIQSIRIEQPAGRQRFIDSTGHVIRNAYKLYPWEAMLSEEPCGSLLLSGHHDPVNWFEPAWKVLLSTKALLPVLWEMNPDCPYLLPAYGDGPRDLDAWISKPLQGREGDNMRIHVPGQPDVVTPGGYDDDGVIYQQFEELPSFDGNYAMVGSWIIDGESAGGLVRESDGPVTDYYSRVCPHVITDALEPDTSQTTMWRYQRVGDNLPVLTDA